MKLDPMEHITNSEKKVMTIPDIKELITLIKNNTEPKAMALSFKLSVSSIYRWMDKISSINFDPERAGELIKKKGPKSRVFDEIHTAISNVLANDCSLTQRGIMRKLEENNINLSQSTVCLNLKRMNLTRKRLVLISNKKNDPETINYRHSFGVKYRRFADSDLLYLDETGFNIHSRRSYGYSPVNSPARITVRSSRGKNVSLLALISKAGVIKFKIINGACNSEYLKEFLLSCVSENVFRPNNVLLMDNVNFHKTNDIKTLLRNNNVNFDYLPIYSPELNPIEEMFSSLKSCYYNLPYPNNFEEIKLNLETIFANWERSGRNFENFYSHMRRYLDKAFMRENF